ncbi:MAG: ferrous iron transport protein A [Holophagaceae bacterium]|jgi:ferrous iron transport protein A
MNLETVPLGTMWRVKSVHEDPFDHEKGVHLEEIGFLEGELVSVLVRAFPGDDPMVVRVGHSTFALRRVEARCVEVEPDYSSV